MRLIDADAFINDARDRYCKDCDKRKGIKSGKRKFIYEIGDVPCRACDVDDMVNDIESAPTVSPDMAQVLAYECGKDAVERKKGEWIFEPKDAIELMFTKPKCSKCGYESADGGNFCSNCGAEMRGGEDE